MLSSFKKFWLMYSISLTIIILMTLWSGNRGEKLFFLIPVILIPISLVECFLISPIWIMVFKFSKFKEIDLSIFRKPLSLWYSGLCGLSLGFVLPAGFAGGNILFISLTYFIVAIHIDIFMIGYLWLKFKSEIKAQDNYLNTLSASNLYSEIMFLISEKKTERDEAQ